MVTKILDNKLVAAKLKAFGDAKFKTLKEFAEALEMSSPALKSSYLNGRSIPGGEILAKLMKLGCDIKWLLSDNEVTPSIINEQPSPEYKAQTEIEKLKANLRIQIKHLSKLIAQLEEKEKQFSKRNSHN